MIALAALAMATSACATYTYAGEPDETCEHAAVCDPGDEAVEACPADGSCYTATACGDSIQCLDSNDDCHYPKCAPGSEQVEECPADTTCSLQTHCGEDLLCAEVPRGCPQEPVTDGMPCHPEDAGQECGGKGLDPYCGDWTCFCAGGLEYYCYPDWCE